MRGNGIWKQKFKNIATITTNKKVITLSVILLLIAGVSGVYAKDFFSSSNKTQTILTIVLTFYFGSVRIKHCIE